MTRPSVPAGWHHAIRLIILYGFAIAAFWSLYIIAHDKQASATLTVAKYIEWESNCTRSMATLATCQMNLTELQSRHATLNGKLAKCLVDTRTLESDIGFEKSGWLLKWFAEVDASITTKDRARLHELRMALLAWFGAFIVDMIQLAMFIPRTIMALMLSLAV